ncbi:SPE2 [[Candida] subhashii]|uniref:SPE2 n=1 Tax=[Candida] subhashii TaxID=561895 RepID=A0A8J5UN84_9ASCO|nr:SPE2 [[Candida] subhashii]KAG7663497.1 SPE2 [[Candida] subhashii]
MVAPAYYQDSYVDHELSANLDSTFAFEGPEKLLEIWFWSSEGQLPNSIPSDGLRSIPLENWIKLLDLVSCKVLSMKSSKYMDAYLLSESSLFVFAHKLILKTCGTTTTLACLQELFETVRDKLNIAMTSKEIYKIFYSRRSFMFPDKQIHVHRDWKSEVSLLKQHFNNGKSYVVGNFDSDDHWYLFVGGEEPSCPMVGNIRRHLHHDQDQTFEILMTELDPEKAHKFHTSRKPGVESLIKSGVDESDLGHDVGLETMAESGLDSIFEPSRKHATHLPSPSLSDSSDQEQSDIDSLVDSMDHSKIHDRDYEFIHDAFSFTPCGFSSNSICSNIPGGYYYTLHITPESGWSYASFETNYPFSNSSPVDIMTVVTRILKIFQPRRFSMTLINELEDEENFSMLKSGGELILRDLGYKKQEKALYDLKNEYNLLYLNFEKI